MNIKKLSQIALAGFPFFGGPTYGGTSIGYSTGGSMSQIHDANGLIVRIASIGDVIVYLLIALAVLYIVYATVMYLIMGKEGADRKEAGMRILWGIVGLFIIVSLWGLVSLLVNTFPTYNELPPGSIPSANFVNGQH